MEDKTTLRVLLYKGANDLCKELAVLACESNADEETIEFSELEEYFNEKQKREPGANVGLVCTVLRHYLVVNKKINGSWEKQVFIEKFPFCLQPQ